VRFTIQNHSTTKDSLASGGLGILEGIGYLISTPATIQSPKLLVLAGMVGHSGAGVDVPYDYVGALVLSSL
jgi:hypothetical protein